MTRVAAVDCGTNTVRLLVADLDPSTGTGVERLRTSRIVRLGQDVDRTGRLAPEAVARTLAAVTEYAAMVAEQGVDRVRFCATSAVRDADDSAALRTGVRDRLGVPVEVLTGAEEAMLSFGGAVRGLGAAIGAVSGPVLVVDVGGGSTEVVLGDPGHPDRAVGASLDLGAVRLTERILRADPPTAAEVGRATALIDEALDEVLARRPDPAAAATVVAVSGTGLTLGAVALGLTRLDREALHGAVLPVPALHAATDRLLALTSAQRRALGCVDPGRADVIATGALVLDRVLRRTRVEVVTLSVSDLLDGIAWSRA